MTSDSSCDQFVVCFTEGCAGLTSALDITWKLVPQAIRHFNGSSYSEDTSRFGWKEPEKSEVYE